MVSKIIDKLTSLRTWQLLLVGVLVSEVATLLLSALCSFVIWGHVSCEVLVIGMIDSFLVALVIMTLTIIIVKRISIAELTNKKLLEEIEERKIAEAENRRLEKQLRQAQKMEAIGTLAGGIAHDFNNILAAILGYSEMARGKLSPDDKIGQDLDQVIKAGNRAADLVQQILTFSRQGEEKLQPLKVQLVIKEALKLLRASLPTTIQLKEHIDNDCGAILADPTQIHQILMNLCTNAKDALGKDSGTLTVSLAEIEITGAEMISGCPQIPSGRYLDLIVSDTGSGMDDLTRSKIFNPFFTTKEKGKGTGLGLAVVHGIIKQHNGEITVASGPVKGTTFHVYLPVLDSEDGLVVANRVEAMPCGDGERILFVDDEVALAGMMQEILESLGYTVTVFTSSREALAAFKKTPDGFDLLITDMTMPDMSGVDLAGKVLALNSNFPVILCTGFSESIDEAGAKSLGISEYLKKPIDKFTLASAIRNELKAI